MNKGFRELLQITDGDFKLSRVQTCQKSNPLKTISEKMNQNVVFRYLLNIPKKEKYTKKTFIPTITRFHEKMGIKVFYFS